jgi:phosphoribosylanthranilate isomerase
MNSSAPKIKICGLTRYDDAALAAECGAWGLGFIFSDKSPRCCTTKAAGEIIRRLNEEKIEVEKVGVFLNESAETINGVAEEIGLTFAQLHGSETPEECAKIHINVLKAIQHLDINENAAIDAYPCWLLMDAVRVGDNWGGTGHTADWSRAKKIATSYPLFLAGNLGPDNVVEALQEVRPLGIDLSSSIEKAHGIKDHDKLKRLFRVLKDAGYAH